MLFILPPVCNAVRSLRFTRFVLSTLSESRKEAIKAELQRLVDTGIILPVYERADWVSQISIAEKKSGMRIDIDSRPLNKVPKREDYRLPVLEDIASELSQAFKFSVSDLESGYPHCELDYPSSLLTTDSPRHVVDTDGAVFLSLLQQAVRSPKQGVGRFGRSPLDC